MKIPDTSDARRQLRAIDNMEAGPQRLTRYMKLASADLARFPLADPSAPAAVVKLRAEYAGVVAMCDRAIAEVNEAAAKDKQAAEAFLDKAAQAKLAGKPAPKLTTAPSATHSSAALFDIQACERLLIQAHDRLVDACLSTWPDWRRATLAAVDAEHRELAAAAAAVVAKIGSVQASYNSVLKLDTAVTNSFGKINQQVGAETRAGLRWYQATHDPRPPLSTITVGKGRAAQKLPIADVAAALAAAIETPSAFAAAGWVPPTDPEHDTMQATPPDPGDAWVIAAARRQVGACHVCGGGREQLDAAVIVDGKVQPVHSSCLATPPSPVRKAINRKREDWARHGHPAQPDAEPQGLAPGDLDREDADRARSASENMRGGRVAS